MEMNTGNSIKKRTLLGNGSLVKDLMYNRYVYLMAIPVIVFYTFFHYAPMYGVIIGFKDFNPRRGILGSEWVGLLHFRSFLTSYYFWRLLRNTLLISLNDIIWGFPAPIILALMINEARLNWLKKSVQTLTYLPYFISMVVICGIIIDFTGTNGVVNDVTSFFGAERQNFLAVPEYFRTVYVVSGIWQRIGFNSIIYLSAISAIDPQLYEAAYLDGAGRFSQGLHITLPGIAPTIIILLILRVGQVMTVGFEKIILLYNPLTYETADVIQTFVYRKGLIEFDFSYSTAVGLFNSLVNLFILIIANRISRSVSETSLW